MGGEERRRCYIWWGGVGVRGVEVVLWGWVDTPSWMDKPPEKTTINKREELRWFSGSGLIHQVGWTNHQKRPLSTRTKAAAAKTTRSTLTDVAFANQYIYL